MSWPALIAMYIIYMWNWTNPRCRSTKIATTNYWKGRKVITFIWVKMY